MSLILFTVYSEYLTKKTPEAFEDFRIRRQIIRNVKSVGDTVLLAKEETALPDMLDRLSDTGLYFEMEINVEENYVMKISR